MKRIRMQAESLRVETFDLAARETASTQRQYIKPEETELTACDCGLWTLSPYMATCVDAGCGYP